MKARSMKTAWLPLVLSCLAGCGSNSSGSAAASASASTTVPPAPTAKPKASATAEAPASVALPPKVRPLVTGQALAGDTCPKRMEAFTKWLKLLHSEGPLVANAPEITLVEVNQAAVRVQDGPRMSIGAQQIVIDGKLAANSKEPGFDTKEIVETLTKVKELARQAPGAATAASYVVLEIDRAAPWHAVVAAVDAAAKAGTVYGTFLFAAPTQVSPPPASSYHTDFHARFGAGADKPAILLKPAGTANPSAVDAIYADCEPASKVVHTPSDQLVRDLPKAITACGCKVDTAAVQALLWLAYDRYSGAPRAGLTLNLARAGDTSANEVAARGTAAWTETSALVREAAGKGKPVLFRAKRPEETDR